MNKAFISEEKRLLKEQRWKLSLGKANLGKWHGVVMPSSLFITDLDISE